MTHRSRQEHPPHIVNAPQVAASYHYYVAVPASLRLEPILQRAAVLADDAHHLIRGLDLQRHRHPRAAQGRDDFLGDLAGITDFVHDGHLAPPAHAKDSRA
jgi:hypothetical protein